MVNLVGRAHHPMIMVDRILIYQYPEVIAERYITANDFAFVGHFPHVKMWPGVLTIEGLRQTCELAIQLHYLEEQNLMDTLYTLQKSPTHFSSEEQERILVALREQESTSVQTQRLNVKLLAPVFAGCLMRYHIHKKNPTSREWTVSARVEERTVAKGTHQSVNGLDVLIHYLHFNTSNP